MNEPIKREPVSNEVPSAIRLNSELDTAVREAKVRFERLLEEHDVYEARREFLWVCGDPLQNKDPISLTVRETDELGRRNATRTTDGKSLLDPLRREGMLLSILGELLQKRWRKVNDKLLLDLRQLEVSEMEHAH